MFPSVINTFNIVSATDRLNSPSHSTLHNSVSSVITQVETFIGRTGNSSTVGTLVYDIRSPDSDGGGHVQTANKGGTGQTSYTKGDLLVATSSSVISKLAVGADGKVLVTDSSVAGGIKWGDASNKLLASASIRSYIVNNSSVATVSILSTTVLGSTLGLNNAIRATAFVNNYTTSGGSSSVLLSAFYGNNQIGSILLNSPNTVVASVSGQINYTLISNNNVNSQRGILQINLSRLNSSFTAPSVIAWYTMGTSSVNSSADQTLGMTLTGGDSNSTSLNIDGVIVEKIT